MTRYLATPILLAMAFALSSCGSDVPKGFVCPATASLVDAASITQFAPGATDASGMLYKADITRAFSECSYYRDTNTITMRVETDFRATRPLQSNAASYTMPYFIAIALEGTTIVDKKNYRVAIAFEPGQASTTVSDRVEDFTFKPSADKKSTDYELLSGIQLTKEQLDYNRKVGRYPQ